MSGKLKKGESVRPNGTYCFRKMTRGVSTTLYAKTLPELRRKESELDKSESLGINQRNAKLTVAEYVEKIINKDDNKRLNTKDNQRMLYSSIKGYQLLSMKIKDVRYEDCDNFVRELCKKYAKGTVVDMVGLVKLAFKEAQRENAIAQNYLSLVRLSDTEYKFQSGRKIAALSEKDQEKFLEYAKKTDSPYYWDYVCLIETGLRVSELYGLTRNDIDFENRFVNVDKQLYYCDGGYHVGDPKTKSGKRKVPLSDRAVEAFHRVIDGRPQVKVETFVDGVGGFLFLNRFGNPKTGQNMGDNIRFIRRTYKEATGEELPNITPHILRHTFDSNLYRKGFDLMSLQYVMGHSDVKLTLSRYTDVEFEHVHEAFNSCLRS